MAVPADFFIFIYFCMSDPGIPVEELGTALPEPAVASAQGGPFFAAKPIGVHSMHPIRSIHLC